MHRHGKQIWTGDAVNWAPAHPRRCSQNFILCIASVLMWRARGLHRLLKSSQPVGGAEKGVPFRRLRGLGLGLGG